MHAIFRKTVFRRRAARSRSCRGRRNSGQHAAFWPTQRCGRVADCRCPPTCASRSPVALAPGGAETELYY